MRPPILLVVLAAVATGCRPEGPAKPAPARAGLRFAASQSATKRATAPYVVDCGPAGKQACLLAAKACGARVICSVPTNSLLVETSVFALAVMYTNRTFAAVRELAPADKVAAGFAGGEATVVVLSAADRPVVEEFLRQKGVEPVVDSSCGRCELRAKLTRALADELAGKGEVRRIAP